MGGRFLRKSSGIEISVWCHSTRTLARRVIEKTKAYKILKGYQEHARGRHEPYRSGCSFVFRHLLVDFPEIAELDMNPVLVKDGKPIAVDARVLDPKNPRWPRRTTW